MRFMKSSLLLALLALFLVGPAIAQEDTAEPGAAKPDEKPKGPVMDDLSKKTLETFEKKAYHLGRAGAKKASCKISVKIASMMGDMGGNATYEFDGEKGSLTWDNEQLGRMLGQRGFAVEHVNRDFDEKGFEKALAGAKLTAKKAEDGTVTVSVEGETKDGYKTFTFNKQGLLAEGVLSKDTGMGQKQDFTVKMTWEEKEGAVLLTGETVSFEIPGMGAFVQTATTTYAKVGDFWLKTKREAKNKMGGQDTGSTTFEYSEWKLNDDVGKKKE